MFKPVKLDPSMIAHLDRLEAEVAEATAMVREHWDDGCGVRGRYCLGPDVGHWLATLDDEHLVEVALVLLYQRAREGLK